MESTQFAWTTNQLREPISCKAKATNDLVISMIGSLMAVIWILQIDRLFNDLTFYILVFFLTGHSRWYWRGWYLGGTDL